MEHRLETADAFDDFSRDIAFGTWLREQRQATGLSVNAVSLLTGMSLDRIEGLESGGSIKGITRSEAEQLANVLNVRLKRLLQEALR